jgi:hypothetical protein
MDREPRANVGPKQGDSGANTKWRIFAIDDQHSMTEKFPSGSLNVYLLGVSLCLLFNVDERGLRCSSRINASDPFRGRGEHPSESSLGPAFLDRGERSQSIVARSQILF